MAHYAGLDVLTLANNHSMEYGSTALLDTLRYVRATGIKTIGAGANSTLARRPAFVNAGGLLSVLFEKGETDEEGVVERIRAIGPRLSALWQRAREEGVAPHRVADRIVEERLAAARARATR